MLPLSKMMINLVKDEAHDYGELVQHQNKIRGNMLGCKIDFIIKELENTRRGVVASRKDAMYKKRKILYIPDIAGNFGVSKDRTMQTKVITITKKVVRVEIFGTECSIPVRLLSVKIRSLEDIFEKQMSRA